MSKLFCIRTLVQLLVYSLIGLALILVTSVWWLPRALPSVLRQFDVQVDSVERQSSGRLQLTRLAMETDSASVVLSALEIPSLHQYLWQRIRGGFTEAALIELPSLDLRLHRLETQVEPNASADMVSIFAELRSLAATYGAWFPPVELGVLSVHSAEGELIVRAEEMSFQNWAIQATVEVPTLSPSLEIEALLKPNKPWALRVDSPNVGLQAELELDEADAGLSLIARLLQGQEVVDGAAFFVQGESMPSHASLQSKGFSLNPQWLPSITHSQLASIRLLNLDIAWKEGRYVGVLESTSTFLTEGEMQVPLNADIAIGGDLETLRVDTCEVTAEWGQLRLREPLEIRLADGSVAQNAELRAVVDLAKQPFVDAQGQVEAGISVAPSFESGPNLKFELMATNPGYASFSAESLVVSGDLKGSKLRLDHLRLKPTGGSEAERIELQGMANLATKDLDFSYQISVGADWLNAQIGQTYFSQEIKSSGSLAGSFERPIFEGVLEELTLGFPELEPIALGGVFRTEGFNQLMISGAATCQGAVIDAALDASLGEGVLVVDLKKFIWTDPERPTLELLEPTRLSYQFSAETDSLETRLSVEPFHFAGPELDVSGQWNTTAGLKLVLRNVTLLRVGRWVKRELPPWVIEAVEISLAELQPQLIGTIGVHMESRVIDESPLRLDFAGRLSREGTNLDQINLDFSGEPLLRGAMAAPVQFQLPIAGAPFWTLLDDGVLEGALTGSASGAFSDWLTRVTGVRLREVAVNLNLTGSLRQPVGVFNLEVASLDTGVEKVPTLEKVKVVAKAERDAINVEQFGFFLNQSEVSGSLTLPVTALIDAVSGDVSRREAFLAASLGRIELIDWRAENWSDFLPPLVRPSGRFQGTLELKPDLDVNAYLTFEGFALRPTQSLPLVDQVGGEIELTDRMLKIDSASVRVGGSPMAFTGWLDASDLKNPLWEFNAIGQNVPLVRTTDMILRSDLNLKASHESRLEAPLISGDLNLRSSTMLVEFDPLAPNVESGPQAKPPYFSIKEPSIADWRFDLTIEGDSFMRVRSPYFRTQLSANFELGGTFAEPLLIGAVRTVEGELRFPGARMRIENGEAYIEASRPDAVQLNFTGTAQQASYIVTMDVTQTLGDPHIQFQSSPALSNAAIVRLLATGSTTGGGVGAVGLYLGQGLLGTGGMDEQFSDRLTVDVGEATSRSGRSTVGVRYDLSNDLYLKGEYDVYDAYNLDLIWSIFRR